MQYNSDYNRKSFIEFGAKLWIDIYKNSGINPRTKIFKLSDDEFVEDYKMLFNFLKKELNENIMRGVVEFYASSSQKDNLDKDVILELFKRFCSDVKKEIIKSFELGNETENKKPEKNSHTLKKNRFCCIFQTK